MKVFRVPFRSSIILLCSVAATLFSGCATATKPAPPSANHPPSVSLAPIHVEAKAIRPSIPADTVPSPGAPVPTVPVSSPAPSTAPVTLEIPTLPAVVVRRATIIGSQESSMLLDNFTAFVATVDGNKIEAGRNGWNVPLEIETGHRILGVEFNRGVFLARGRLEFEAVANVHYELKYATDAELFGHNSYCNFWIIDVRTGETVSMLSKAAVEKMAAAPSRPLLP